MRIINSLWLLVIIDCIYNLYTVWCLKSEIQRMWHSLFLLIFSYLLYLLEIDYVDLVAITVTRVDSLFILTSFVGNVLLLVCSIIKANKTNEHK